MLPKKSRKKILITAGPTREMLDPVRYLSNLSTGTMGCEIARAALVRGHHVTLVTGPVTVPLPRGARVLPIVSAADLSRVCNAEFPRHDVLVMSAAVCDFTAARCRKAKMSRAGTPRIILKQTPDIVAGLARRKGNRIVIGFCLETRDWVRRAVGKLRRKNLDGIVANYYTKRHSPFGNRRVSVALIDRRGNTTFVRAKSKRQIAERFFDWMDTLGVVKPVREGASGVKS